MGDTCGALLGGCMMLGQKFGREPEDASQDKVERTTLEVGKLYKWFEKEFGAVSCKEIRTRFAGGVYYDLNVPWQRELSDESGWFNKCNEMVKKTAARTAEILWNAPEE